MLNSSSSCRCVVVDGDGLIRIWDQDAHKTLTSGGPGCISWDLDRVRKGLSIQFSN